jgi:hypothetical protein
MHKKANKNAQGNKMKKQIKNTISIQLQLTGTHITFCYTKKAYKKFCKKRFNTRSEYHHIGVSTEFLNHNNINYEIVVGVSENKDVYGLKSTVVHELSHATNQWMEYYGFNCDELRSYTLQYLYLNIVPFLDELLLKDYNVSIEKKANDEQNIKN